MALVVKTMLASAEDARDLGSTPESGRPLKKGMTTNSSILAWIILMDRGAWLGYSPWGHKQ